MPAFKYNERPLLGFKASKNHLSVFPFSPEAVDARARNSPDSSYRREPCDSRPTSPSLTPRSSNSCATACVK
jgi:hypothetical protein